MLPEELGQAKAQGRGWAGRISPALATRRWSSKRMRIRSGLFLWQHLFGAPCFRAGFLFQNHYPRFTGAPSSFFKGCPPRPSFGGFGFRIR